MGVDREVLLPDAAVLLAESGTDHRERPVPPPDDPLPAEVTAASRVAYAAVGSLLVGWFFFGLLVQRQGWVDSAGESLGTAFTLLLVVSVIGTVRRSRR